jgi:hypothetical protein
MRSLRLFSLGLLCAATAGAQSKLSDWPQHSLDRPAPAVVSPGAAYTIAPPSDAVVLFDGRTLAGWESDSGAAPRWRVENGAIVVVPGTGTLHTKAGFGDAQLHIEWAAPSPARFSGQNRGNSGVFFGDGRYEVQVLDSYNNRTYADGQAAALYGQFPPLVNATRPPGQWQVYDIIYRRPRFGASGAMTSPARLTVFHNGVLVQDNMELVGPTSNSVRLPYEAHADRLPITLQDHGHPVRFRNIWIRDLEAARTP